MLFSEPKIPQKVQSRQLCHRHEVSVLFSEPKIPQIVSPRCSHAPPTGFSALQRAENSSKPFCQPAKDAFRKVSVLFSEPKIPQTRAAKAALDAAKRFSALQRAENSSKPRRTRQAPSGNGCFSALQRAENSSTDPRTCVHPYFRPR